MLYVESRISNKRVEAAARLELMNRLQEKGLVPLIRLTRLSCYDTALLGPERAAEMERIVSAWTNAEGDAPYIDGDIFCLEDFALFLIFNDATNDEAGMRAGIIYEAETQEPEQKLEAFCRNVATALQWKTSANANGGDAENGVEKDAVKWHQRLLPAEENAQASFDRFAAARKDDNAAAPVKDNGNNRQSSTLDNARALELLNDAEARRALRRIREKHADGSIKELLVNGGAGEWASMPIIDSLREAGLLRHEVLVSCRQKERALFRLPSPETLAIVLSSNATCSECGKSLADEKAEELIAPTELAHTLLEDGSWLTARLRASLREAGVPDANVAAGASDGEGESYIMANVCHELFLFALRDGELTNAFARRVLDRQMETEAAHLVVITTGKIHDDGRVRLRDGVRRRAQEGSGFELISVEGMERAVAELHHAFERVSQKQLANELYELDRSLGLNAGHLIATRFRLRQTNGALEALAASAVGALAGSLREF